MAGLATGLVATGEVRDGVLRQEKVLRVGMGGDPEHDCALVDVAVSAQRWIGARALYRPEEISEIFVASASPDAVGLSAVAGLLEPVPREAEYGLHVKLEKVEQAQQILTVPLAPGLVVPVGIGEYQRIKLGEATEVEATSGSLALDGEREIELGPESRVEVRLDTEGPVTIDVAEVMRQAAGNGLLNGAS